MSHSMSVPSNCLQGSRHGDGEDDHMPVSAVTSDQGSLAAWHLAIRKIACQSSATGEAGMCCLEHFLAMTVSEMTPSPKQHSQMRSSGTTRKNTQQSEEAEKTNRWCCKSHAH